jgi:FkbM family methyltransferase
MEIKLAGAEFRIDHTYDHYGSEFWDKLNNNLYEPDTIKFLETNVGPETVLLDIGAANGAMTLFAAARGSHVVAYEPEPTIYQILEKNLHLNPRLVEKVSLKNAGISISPEQLRFGKGENREVLSDIVIDDNKENMNQVVEILSLTDELLIVSNYNRKIILKMDIEGAEWRILTDKGSLSALETAEATLLVAFHPGFYRRNLPKWLRNNGIGRNIRRLQNFNDSLRVYNSVTQHGVIKRTNLDKVPNKYRFAFLIFSGYFEFVISFSQH